MSQNTLESLSEKLDLLIEYCEQLKQDNQQLRQREQQWHQERNRLIEKNDLARTRVEAMITHLKGLQQSVS